jgi:hypothetical protein
MPAPIQMMALCQSQALIRAVYAAAQLGIADRLLDGPRSTTGLADCLDVNEQALYRTMRCLASAGIFEEVSPAVFANTDKSQCLCAGVPGSIRSVVILWCNDFTYRSIGEVLHTVKTGEPGRSKAFGPDGWAYMQEHPEVSKAFDDAMTELCFLAAPAIAASYDFGRWGRLMDVGGGNGLMLSALLRMHPALTGVLSDQPDVLARARERAFLSGPLESRSSMQACDFLTEVPAGCRAYMLKTVIIDWDDAHVSRILSTVRRAVPPDGALLLVDFFIAPGNAPDPGKLADMGMMMLWGSKVRTIEEIRVLLDGAGFNLNRVVPTPAGYSIVEALPR